MSSSPITTDKCMVKTLGGDTCPAKSGNAQKAPRPSTVLLTAEPLMIWPLQVCSARWVGTHGPGYNVQRSAQRLMRLRYCLGCRS